MIGISNTKILTLTVITPPGTQGTVSRAIMKPGTSWADLMAKLPTPTLPGCPFLNWSLTADGQSIDGGHTFTESTIVYGKFENTSLITVNTGTDSPAEYKIPIVPGTTLKEVVEIIPKLKKDGYNFQFWSLDGTSAAEPTYRMKGNETLHAVWTAQGDSIKLTFVSGDLFKPIEERFVARGSQWANVSKSVLYPTPASELNFFKHWSLESNTGNAIDLGALFNEDTTIYAVGDVSDETISINFNSHGGTRVPAMTAPKGTLYGYVKQLIDDPVRNTDSDHLDEFAGWALTELADDVCDVSYAFEQSCTLHAQWITRIDITVKNNGPDRTISKVANYWSYQEVLDQVECLPEHTPSETTFAYWSLRDGGTDMGTSGKFSNDANIWAVYDPYTVITTNSVGGTGATSQYKAPKNTTWASIKEHITAPTLSENTFKHWSLTRGGEAIPDEHKFAGEVTIFAVWVPYVSVSFITKGTAVPTVKVPNGTTWSSIKDNYSSSLDGHRFAHWSLTDAGSEVDAGHQFTEDVELHAVFVKTWTVTFDSDGGTPTPDALTVDDGTTWENIKAKVPSPSKPGMTFTGWSVVE